MSATELSRIFHGHVPKERLQPVLQQLEAQRRALDYRLRQTPLEKERIRQLARIGANLNQLAR